VSMEDLYEELVGEIPDISGTSQRDIIEDAEGRLVVSGTVRLDELGERLGRDLDDERVETVGGLILTELHRPPRRGDGVRQNGVEYVVVSTLGRGVATARARLLPEVTEQSQQSANGASASEG